MSTSNSTYSFLRGGLLSQLSFLALLTTTVILTFFGWQRIQTRTNSLTHTLYSSMEANSHRLATALALPLYNFNDETVTALCNSLLEDPNIIQISVNANNRQLTFPAAAVRITLGSSSDIISTTADISHHGTAIGKITIYASTSALHNEIQQTTRSTFLQIIVLDLFLVFTIVFFLSRQFITPLTHLQEAAKQIAEGDLSRTIRPHNRNELGQLAGNLETMRHMLQEKITDLENEVEERRNTEAELSKTKNYLDNIINSMPSQLIGVDADHRVILWNKQAEAVNTASAPLNQVGKKLAEVFPHLAAEDENISRAIASRQVIHDNTLASRIEDFTRYEDITIYPLVTNGVQGAVIRIDDITEQHNMQEELAHSRKLDAIGQLAGGIAHDFNNMIGGILGGAELLSSVLDDNEKGRQYLDIIIQASKRAGELNQKLLAFARKDTIESAPVDVAKAVHETENILIHTLDKKISVTISMEAKNTIVIGDLSQLQNALINLGINSAHAMPEGGELFYRVIEKELDEAYCAASPFAITPGRYLQIEVRDTGTGISEKHRHLIFDPFFTTKGHGKGTGLGLAAVHSTVEQHHGAITVYSEPGISTSFHIYLPLAELQTGLKYDETALTVSGSGTILVIDDEPVLCTTAKEMLTHLGYQVILAEDGMQGLEIFTNNPDAIDLVLADMLMPRMNGKECFLALKKIAPDVRVVIASGFCRDSDIEELKTKGLRGFIRKPYTTSELSKTIAQAMQ